jgi:hypothetical protein
VTNYTTIYSLPRFGDRKRLIPFTVQSQTPKQLRLQREGSSFIHHVRIAELDKGEWFTCEIQAARFLVATLSEDVRREKEALQRKRTELGEAEAHLRRLTSAPASDAADPVAAN